MKQLEEILRYRGKIKINAILNGIRRWKRLWNTEANRLELFELIALISSPIFRFIDPNPKIEKKINQTIKAQQNE